MGRHLAHCIHLLLHSSNTGALKLLVVVLKGNKVSKAGNKGTHQTCLFHSSRSNLCSSPVASVSSHESSV